MPDTINEMGLEKYLEGTRGLHHNLGYAEFVDMLDLKVPKVEIAKRFNVSRSTIESWADKLKKKEAKK